MIPKVTLSWLFLILIAFSSCVSSKKYKAKTSEAETAQAANADLTKKNSDLQAQLNESMASNKMLAEERDRYQKEADNAKKQLAEMQSAVNDYMSNMDAVQKKVSDKMADYADRGADVSYKNGQVHVNLQDQLLFRPGSARISKDGETALGTLAEVLGEHPDLKVLVVGHTDDRAGRGSDNWSLSTERANSVVRMLRSMKVDPSRLTSAGQGQYNAVGDNSTEEGRASNRRTEIILSPSEPFKLLDRQN